jgi:PilZ domain-containing protein
MGLARITSANRPEDAEPTLTEPDNFLRPRTRARRAHPRHKFEVAAEIRLLNAPTPMWVTSRNLSQEGCSVQTTAAVPRGIELNVAFWLGEERVWAQGVVVDSLYGFGTGIRFTSMSRQDRQLLQNFLAQNKSEISDRRQTEARVPDKAFAPHHEASRVGQAEPSEFIITVPLHLPVGSSVLD